MDTNQRCSCRTTARDRNPSAPQLAMRDDVSPPSHYSASRTRARASTGSDARVNSPATMNNASAPDHNQQDPWRRGRSGQDASARPRLNTSHLVHQLQQLQLPVRTQAFNQYASLLPPPPPASQRPTQTVSRVNESMRGYGRRISLGSSDTPPKALQSFVQWPAVSAPTNHPQMLLPTRSHSHSPLSNNRRPQQVQHPPPTIVQPAAEYSVGFTRPDRDSRALAEEKFDGLMNADDDDVLLDDDSLDMLVSTLARETARIEATRTSYASEIRSHNTSGGVGARSENAREGDKGGDNQRYAMECDDDSSDGSSHASTPTTSTSDTSGATYSSKSKQKPKRVRRACIVPGCGKRSRSQGLCIAHGGGRRCIVEGCDKSSQGGNHCIKHGGGKRCSVDGCDKAAQTNALCKAHGGGPRCQFEDCEKSSQGGGYCRQHGGGKRCAFAGCMKGTQRGSYCALHGGSRLCVVDGCRRNDRGGGYCAHHGGGKRCTIEGCARPSRRNSLCSTHLRVLGNEEHSLEDLNQSIDQGLRRTLASAALASPSHSPLP